MQNKALSGILFTKQHDQDHIHRFDHAYSGQAAVGASPPSFFHAPFYLRFGTTAHDSHLVRDGLAVAVNGLIYNRADLYRRLALDPATADRLGLGELVWHAFKRWGEDCAAHLHGDWSFVAWDIERCRLTLARDHLGNAALYFHATDSALAFSTSRDLLPALGAPPPQLDELSLAQHLVSWPAYHGSVCFDRSVSRLPPAHYISARPGSFSLHRYWQPATTPLHRKDLSAYGDALREVFTTAVAERLAATPSPASMLSGGLDSGSVTAIAAGLLRQQGRRLNAYTSVPLAGAPLHAPGRFGDEWDFAQALSRHNDAITHIPIRCGDYSPIQAIRDTLAIHGQPVHGAANLYWILGLFRHAVAAGDTMVLTGQMGNGGFSWTGDVFSQPLSYQIHKLGLRPWAKQRLKRALPSAVYQPLRRRRARADWSLTAIAPALAARLDLHARRLDDPRERPGRSAMDTRLYILKPGRNIGTELYHNLAQPLGLTITDPTADARVLDLVLSIPDKVHIDPATGLDRCVVRAAMAGILPDQIRLNRLRGRQAADLLTRLLVWRDEVESALDEIERGQAAAYLDVGHMRRVWGRMQTEQSDELSLLASTVVSRGIMAGLYVNQLSAPRIG